MRSSKQKNKTKPNCKTEKTMIKNSFKIIQKGNVIVKRVDVPNKISDSNKANIEKIWHEEYKNKNSKIFNGEVLSFVDVHSNHGNVAVSATFTEYKNVLASRKKSDLGLNIKQIGVSGITIVTDQKKEFVLFSTRSSDTTEYPGYLELVPSGNIDKSTILKDDTIDYISKINEEFVEETGLSNNDIKKVTSFCFVYDTGNEVYDVGCIIHADAEKNKILEGFSSVSEYKNPKLIPMSSLEEFVGKNQQKIVPTSLAMLECFFGLENYSTLL